MPYAVAIGLENGIVKVFDTFLGQTLLLEIVVGKDILQVASSNSQEDMFIVVLTKDNMLLTYGIVLERKFKLHSNANNEGNGERHLHDENVGQYSPDSINGVQISAKGKKLGP